MAFSSLLGFACVALAAVLWGAFGTMARFFFVNDVVGPLTLLEIRLILSFVLLFLYTALFRPALLRIRKADVLPLAIFGLGGLGAVQLFYLLTISQLNVATAVFLQYLAPVLIAVWNVLRHRQAPGRLALAAIILATLGGFLIMLGTHAQTSLTMGGLITGLASALAFAFYSVYGKQVAYLPPWTVLLYGLGFPLAAWSFVRPPWTALAGHGPVAWAAFLYLAVFSTILPFGLYLKGLSLLTPLRAGLTATIEPVVAAGSAYLVLGETLHSLQTAGAALILGGVVLIQLQRTKRD
ncbi:MAG: EamA family transporter [Peptococcaceae bacterium]|jgi:drug/metabolite transporter (DMT)-like permease|nr:EamA family transporter [Peptococcaceae bacterium]